MGSIDDLADSSTTNNKVFPAISIFKVIISINSIWFAVLIARKRIKINKIVIAARVRILADVFPKDTDISLLCLLQVLLFWLDGLLVLVYWLISNLRMDLEVGIYGNASHWVVVVNWYWLGILRINKKIELMLAHISFI